MRKVLFLDIDGVLNNSDSEFGGPECFDPASVGALVRVLNTTGAEIVVSSSWRFNYEIFEFNEVLTKVGIPPRVVDYTALTETRDGGFEDIPRGEHIMDWVKEHPEIVTWAVVDDDVNMPGVPVPRLVRTEMNNGGLRPEHAEALIYILGAA